jgi:phosphatidylglycerol:prolipoprotein diacylglycerol transferase
MKFHLYGFIIGIAVLTGYLIIEKIIIKKGVSESNFLKIGLSILSGGVLGARLWHVLTDFYLYRDNLVEIFYIWQGGLSILGAIFGGLISLLIVSKKLEVSKKLILDSIVFGLPVSQFIGRWANFFNQELYGLPTNLPWKIYIEFHKRSAGFEEFKYFHPLFIYEGLLVLVGLLIMFLLKKKKKWNIGDGKYFKFYLAYYLTIRFILDFLRIEKGNLIYGLGINQLIIFTIGFFMFIWWIMSLCKKSF